MSARPRPLLTPCPLWDEAASRHIEAQALAHTPPHHLMAQAGESLARLARALTPHSPLFWVVCGPGNNGGDGMVAALRLHQWGHPVWVTRSDEAPKAGSDAEWAWRAVQEAGLRIHTQPPHTPWGLAMDALFGLGAKPGLSPLHQDWLNRMRQNPAPVLCADVPSGLHPKTGQWFGPAQALVRPAGTTHTLSLLTPKTGLFTGSGQDAAGQVWIDDLGTQPDPRTAQAICLGPPEPTQPAHDTHKGRFGRVWVIGGDHGLSGAAWLAAQSALRRGAGRVHVQLLAPETTPLPRPMALMSASTGPEDLHELTVVAGCGGGQAIAAALPRVLSTCPSVVLDADALNAMAHDASLEHLWQRRGTRGQQTVITPHPLEAARLLRTSVAEVQADRLQAAQALAQRGRCVVVLKGSGSIIADPDGRLAINPTGNHRLATAGSGDVLAGWIGARLAQGDGAWQAACTATYLHGLQAQTSPGDGPLIADLQ